MKKALEEKATTLNEILNAIKSEFHQEIEKQNVESQMERKKLRLEIKELETCLLRAKQCGAIEVNTHK